MIIPKNRIKNLSLVLLCFFMNLSIVFSQEQSQECGVVDLDAKTFFEYAKRLPDIQNYMKSKTGTRTVSMLPMTFTVFRDPITDNGPTQTQITESLNFLNQELVANNVDVQFYQHGFINYVDNADLSYANCNDTSEGVLYGYQFSTSNVYVHGFGGVAGFPCPIVFDPTTCEFNDDNKIRVGRTFSNSINNAN